MRVGPLQNLRAVFVFPRPPKVQRSSSGSDRPISQIAPIVSSSGITFVVACQNHIGAGERIASAHDIFAETRPFNTVSNRIAGKPL